MQKTTKSEQQHIPIFHYLEHLRNLECGPKR